MYDHRVHVDGWLKQTTGYFDPTEEMLLIHRKSVALDRLELSLEVRCRVADMLDSWNHSVVGN